jgi:hypothetical protein
LQSSDFADEPLGRRRGKWKEEGGGWRRIFTVRVTFEVGVTWSGWWRILCATAFLCFALKGLDYTTVLNTYEEINSFTIKKH